MDQRRFDFRRYDFSHRFDRYLDNLDQDDQSTDYEAQQIVHHGWDNLGDGCYRRLPAIED